jgi:hypothetical protein
LELGLGFGFELGSALRWERRRGNWYPWREDDLIPKTVRVWVRFRIRVRARVRVKKKERERERRKKNRL